MSRSHRRIVAGLTVLAACSDGSSPSAPSRLAPLIQPSGSINTQVVPNEYIVVLQDNVSDVANASAASGAEVTARWGAALRGYAVKVAPGQLNAIRADGRVKFVEPNGVITKFATQSAVPSWGLDRIDQASLPLNTTYTYPGTASNVHAYIIDTGILLTHTQFTGRIGNGFDAVTSGGNATDCDGHGTHVAGTVGGSTFGVAKGVTLHAVRVLNCVGSGTWTQVINGINWAAANRILPAVANMSIGGTASSSVNAATAGLVSAGVFTAVAAGNSNADACGFSPASTPTATTVNSSTTTDARSSFSNFGTCTDIFAPGSGIVSAYIGSNTATATLSGTSMATPHVAGAGALYLSVNPTATPAQVDAALKANATANKISSAGTGSPNLLLNISFLNGTVPPPPPPTNKAPVPDFTITCTVGSHCNMDAVPTTDDGGFANLTFTWTASGGRLGRTGNPVRYDLNKDGTLPNTFNLTLTARDAQGLTASITKTIVIPAASTPPVNQAPVADFTVTCTPRVECKLDASISTDDGGAANLTFSWVATGGRLGRTGNPIWYSFNNKGLPNVFDVTLTATDAGGKSSTKTRTINIQ